MSRVARDPTHRRALWSDGESSGDLVCDDLSLIVLSIARAIDDRDPATPGQGRERVEGLCPSRVSKLGSIARLKLRPAGGIVPEPLPETGTWAKVSGPGVEPELGLRPAPRPDPVDEHAMPIVR